MRFIIRISSGGAIFSLTSRVCTAGLALRGQHRPALAISATGNKYTEVFGMPRWSSAKVL